MSENSVLRFTVSFLLINSRSSIFTKSYQCKNRTTWTAVRAPFFYIDQLMLILCQKKKRVPTLSVIFW